MSTCSCSVPHGTLAWVLGGVALVALVGWYVMMPRRAEWHCARYDPPMFMSGEFSPEDLTETPHGWVVLFGGKTYVFDTCTKVRK